MSDSNMLQVNAESYPLRSDGPTTTNGIRLKNYVETKIFQHVVIVLSIIAYYVCKSGRNTYCTA